MIYGNHMGTIVVKELGEKKFYFSSIHKSKQNRGNKMTDEKTRGPIQLNISLSPELKTYVEDESWRLRISQNAFMNLLIMDYQARKESESK
jgi:hypothetical protein